MAPIRCCFDQTAVWHSDAARGPSTPSFDHLVGGYEERIGHREVECLGGFEVDDKSVLRWLLKWQIARFLAAQNTVDVGSGLAKHCGSIRTVGDQSSGCRKRRIYGD